MGLASGAVPWRCAFQARFPYDTRSVVVALLDVPDNDPHIDASLAYRHLELQVELERQIRDMYAHLAFLRSSRYHWLWTALQSAGGMVGGRLYDSWTFFRLPEVAALVNNGAVILTDEDWEALNQTLQTVNEETID